jgi:hypothetical protein
MFVVSKRLNPEGRWSTGEEITVDNLLGHVTLDPPNRSRLRMAMYRK